VGKAPLHRVIPPTRLAQSQIAAQDPIDARRVGRASTKPPTPLKYAEWGTLHGDL
jgi:hypothetical protein